MAGVKELRLIAFRIGAETFVVDIMAVRQIMPYQGTTPVPTAPAFVEGIVVLRNEVLPIIDLRDRFEVEASKRAEHPLVLVTETEAGLIGLKVDEVQRIVTIAVDVLLPPPPLVQGVRGDLLIAVVPQGDKVYLLLDIDSVLTGEEKRELAGASLNTG